MDRSGRGFDLEFMRKSKLKNKIELKKKKFIEHNGS